jgi:2-aminoadipate transaminase
VNEGAGIHNARFCFTFPTPEIIEEGVKRVAEAIDELTLKTKA